LANEKDEEEIVELKTKKIIAKEGLILIAFFFLWIFLSQDKPFSIGGKLYLATFIREAAMDTFFCVFYYLVMQIIRFILWAVKILRQK